MAPRQRAVLVPGAFGGSRFHACDADCFDGMMAADAKAFGSWAFEDERVDGIIPWHFYNEPNGGEAEPPAEPVDMGVVSLPKALAAWKGIGAKIVGGG